MSAQLEVLVDGHMGVIALNRPEALNALSHGMIKGIADKVAARNKLNPAQKARMDNVGILIAAGLIAGEGLTGLLRAAWKFFFLQNVLIKIDIPTIFKSPSYLAGMAVLVIIALYMIYIPLKNKGAADEPPPPSAVI